MVNIFTQEEWKLVTDIFVSAQKLQEALEEKGFEVICTLSLGIYPACLTFITKRNGTEIFSACILDVLANEERVQNEIFRKGQEVLSTDYKLLEIKMLKERLADLEKPTNGCR